jgi:hypothetical protein
MMMQGIQVVHPVEGFSVHFLVVMVMLVDPANTPQLVETTWKGGSNQVVLILLLKTNLLMEILVVVVMLLLGLPSVVDLVKKRISVDLLYQPKIHPHQRETDRHRHHRHYRHHHLHHENHEM